MVPDRIVDTWIAGLPGHGKVLIISLLGRKHGPTGASEFSFYSFHGALDQDTDRHGRKSFGQWLHQRHAKRELKLIEHPTYDFQPVTVEALNAVGSDVLSHLQDGWTVVLMDSGGQQRTATICNSMNFLEDSAK